MAPQALQRYDECLKRLRYVKHGDEARADDINAPNDCLRAARDWVAEQVAKLMLDPRFVYELDQYLARLRYVKSGDILLPDDHNAIVDTLYKLREVLEKIEAQSYSAGYQEGYSEGYSAGVKEGYTIGYSAGFSAAQEACGCIHVVQQIQSTSQLELVPPFVAYESLSSGVLSVIEVTA